MDGTFNEKLASLSVCPNKKALDCELLNLGMNYRHLQPPGGHSTVDFSKMQQQSQQDEDPTPRRRHNDHMRSTVFGEPFAVERRPETPENETTHHKIFAPLSPPPRPVPGTSPKTRPDFAKSTVFQPDPVVRTRIGAGRCGASAAAAAADNPITWAGGRGAATHTSTRRFFGRFQKCATRDRNPITFEGMAAGDPPSSRRKMPPGGSNSSHFTLEHVEEPDWAAPPRGAEETPRNSARR